MQRKGENQSPLQHNKMTANYYEIKCARFNEGLTQKELAERANICLSVVIKAERGQSISPRSNKAIREALGLK